MRNKVKDAIYKRAVPWIINDRRGGREDSFRSIARRWWCVDGDGVARQIFTISLSEYTVMKATGLGEYLRVISRNKYIRYDMHVRTLSAISSEYSEIELVSLTKRAHHILKGNVISFAP